MHKIEAIPLSDVRDHPERYNTNNDRTHGRPDDYFDFGLKTQTSNWVDQFHSNYRVINLTIQWLGKSADMGAITGTFPRTLTEELDEYLEQTRDTFSGVFDGTPYFVRSDRTSLKYGVHGAGPYRDLKSIIESLVTSIPDHSPLHRDGRGSVKLYLLRWRDIDPDAEFRVFVYKGQVTAISQQNLYTVNKSATKDPSIISKWIDCIMKYFERVVKHRITHIDTYTYDFAILCTEGQQGGRQWSPYFIEINAFGAAYSAGSALFHWMIDHDILCPIQQREYVCFRYTV